MRILHRLACAFLFIAIASIAVAAQSEPPTSANPNPTYYICHATRSDAVGEIWYSMDVPVDGSARFHRIDWQLAPRAEGLKLGVHWDGWAPIMGLPVDRAWVTVYFETTRRIGGDLRIEIRRTPGQHYASEFAYAGPFRRLYRWPDKQLYYIETDGRLGELNSWMSGRDALTFALVGRDGTVKAEDRLDATSLAGVTTAIDAVRPEIEAMAADYRHKCEVPRDIIVTRTGH